MKKSKPYFQGIEDKSEEPVRVFGEKICHAFESIRQELNEEYGGILDDFNLNVLINKESAKGPYCSDKFIHIHDVFLSYLWCHCYGLMILTPMSGKSLNKQEEQQARELLEHAQNLLSYHRKWDRIILPNPEMHGSDEKKLIGVANACFWYAINYILYHEFAHKVLGHLDKLQELRSNGLLSKEKLLQFEKEADLFALNRIMENPLIKGTKHVSSVQMGILSALSSIMFTSVSVSGGISHPDPDHRIQYSIENLDIEDNDFIWGFASWIFITWEQYHNAWFRLWPTNKVGQPFKEQFEETLRLMDKIKEERK